MDAPQISAKQGINIHAVLDDIVDHVPAPKGDPNARCRRSYSTASMTATAASSCSCASW